MTERKNRHFLLQTEALVRLAVLLLFFGVVGVFTVTDHGEHERLATLTTLALSAHVNEHPQIVAAPTQHAVALVVVVLSLLAFRPVVRVDHVVSCGRMLSWADSGIGHMLLTDE